MLFKRDPIRYAVYGEEFKPIISIKKKKIVKEVEEWQANSQ